MSVGLQPLFILWKWARRPPLAAGGVGHDDLQRAAAHPKPHVARAGGARTRRRGVNETGELGTRLLVDFEMPEYPIGEFAHHLVASFGRELQPKQELARGHGRRFYSESRPNNTRARPQSAPICERSASSESNARSSRRRCTKPMRRTRPYRS